MKPIAHVLAASSLAGALLITALAHASVRAQTAPVTPPKEPTFGHTQVARDAARYETFLKKAYGAQNVNVSAAVRNGQGLLSRDARAASRSFASAVVSAPQNAAAWTGLARALLAIAPRTLQGSERYDIPVHASGAAYTGYRRAKSNLQKAAALDVLSDALQRRSYWRPALNALKVAYALDRTPKRQASYEALRATHGFRMVNYTTQSDLASPRVCLEFSEQLTMAPTDFAAFVSVGGRDAAGVTREGRQLCIEGFAHGTRSEIKVRAGLPSSVEETLQKDIAIAVYVPDRKPFVRFNGKSYVLPSRGQQGIPVVSVNTATVTVDVYRVGDRALNTVMQNGDLQRQLSSWDVSTIQSKSGEKVYSGALSVASDLNKEVTTAFPISEAIGTLKPGAYAMVAKPADDLKAGQANQVATQWFIVSDLGLTAFSGDDGVHAFVRSLSDTAPVAGVEVRLVARNNEVLATAQTDARGYARFGAALTRGEGGSAPSMLVAQNGPTDYAFLDLAGSAFDLSDRGVAGRKAPGAVDAFLTTERGVYRPGEDVHLTGLVRTRAGVASTLPVTLIVTRPDGVEHRRQVLADQGLGGRSVTMALAHGSMTGTWRARMHLDPKAAALTETAFLVEDFVPERLDLTLTPTGDAITVGQASAIDVKGVFLYGPPATDMALEGEVVVRASTQGVRGYRGFSFGLADETISPVRERFETLPNTNAAGAARVPVSLPPIPRTSKPLEATVLLRLREPGGRTIERSVRLPIDTQQPRIGVKPLFAATGSGGNTSGQSQKVLGEGETATFDIVYLDRSGKPAPSKQLTWTLSRLDTTWQWYSRDGYWTYDAMTLTRKVESRTVATDATGKATLAMPVTYGRYQLEVSEAGAGNGPVTSAIFSAGWHTGGDTPESPEMLDVALDKSVYAPGETAKLRIADKRGGRALVAVMSGDLKTFMDVDIPAGGGDVPVKVSGTWGAGAYVTAMLYRPMNEAAKRMPSRAVGIKWLALDQAARTLEVALGAAEQIGSGETLTIPVKVDGLDPGEAARVTVSVVDVGILNLTGHQAPNPNAWFNGQTQLSMSIRDYYGRLIDGMRAQRGALRSGGDAAGSLAMQGSPPVEETVAVYSGIVHVGEDGTADVAFDLPDFNGRVRLMAMAWSERKLGHASRDVIVRDPIALTVSAPRFLTLGDKADVRVDVHNVDGPEGAYAFSIDRSAVGAGSKTVADRKVTLNAGERKPEIVRLAPDAVGMTTYAVNITGPDNIIVSRTLKIDVKPPAGDIKRTTVSSLVPGGRLSLSSDLIQELIANRSTVNVSVGSTARFDVPSLLTQLDRYPYGCAEQTVSRALPLIYANAVAANLGIATDTAIKERVAGAVARVFQMQDASGAFGTWGPSYGDVWLTAYVTDFLSRAREQGFDVPERGFSQALDRLQNYVAYAQDFAKGGETRAYALYVLARNKRAPAGELRYYADERLKRFATPLAKAQLGAALAMIGDMERAGRAFGAAIADVKTAHAALSVSPTTNQSLVTFARSDYGSFLRDGAAVMTLAGETKQFKGSAATLKDVVAARFESRRYTSTQEQAWMLLAANTLSGADAPVTLTIDQAGVNGQLNRTYDAADLAKRTIVIENSGKVAVDAVVSVVGAALTPEPEISKGFKVTRRMFTLDGAALDPSAGGVAQNTRAVIVLDVTTESPGGHLLVVDRLPAGFEIENPRLVASGDVKALSWLKTTINPEHTEFRDDRFVAAYNLNGQHGGNAKPAGTTMSMAYIVRAVTPGTYLQPGASVEDMYRPEAYARTAAQSVRVVPHSAN
ncbi:MAG: alpha-2-macroglobulin [Pseudomonadota bacterium]